MASRGGGVDPSSAPLPPTSSSAISSAMEEFDTEKDEILNMEIGAEVPFNDKQPLPDITPESEEKKSDSGDYPSALEDPDLIEQQVRSRHVNVRDIENSSPPPFLTPPRIM